MGNKVVHFEIMTKGDAGELHKFYSDIFGWKIDANNPLSYGLIGDDDAGIAGGIGGITDPNMSGHVTFYVKVPDPEATLQEIEGRGGKRLMGPEEVVPGTTIALFLDPQGNLVGLSKGE